MKVITFPRPKAAPACRGATLFLHIRKTTLIAHMNAPRSAKATSSQTAKHR